MMKKNLQGRMVSTKIACDLIGCSVRVFRLWKHSGKFPNSQKIGSSNFFDVDEIIEFANSYTPYRERGWYR